MGRPGHEFQPFQPDSARPPASQFQVRLSMKLRFPETVNGWEGKLGECCCTPPRVKKSMMFPLMDSGLWNLVVDL